MTHTMNSNVLRRRRLVAGAGLIALTAAACSAASSIGSPEAADTQAATTAPAPATGAVTDTTDTSCRDLPTYPEAARLTAKNDTYCTDIAPLYWEVSDGTSLIPQAFGAIDKPSADGGPPATVGRGDEILIASASKLLFGAYVVEREKLALKLAINATQPVTPGLATAFNALTMRTGYDNMNSDLCALGEKLDPNFTVGQCFHVGKNDTPNLLPDGGVDNVDFYYNGGNFQEYATNEIGLGGATVDDLAREYHRLLGDDLTIAFKFPDLAGGLNMSAGEYAAFLKKILRGELAISDYLDYAPVCTLPASENTQDAGPSCPTAVSSPAPNRPWHYSWGHWIETDGTHSSPGKLGFYPWIDRCEKYYGVVAREDHAKGAYIASANCGTDIRNAFFTGKQYESGAPKP
jgi:hypothetical protein